MTRKGAKRGISNQKQNSKIEDPISEKQVHNRQNQCRPHQRLTELICAVPPHPKPSHFLAKIHMFSLSFSCFRLKKQTPSELSSHGVRFIKSRSGCGVELNRNRQFLAQPINHDRYAIASAIFIKLFLECIHVLNTLAVHFQNDISRLDFTVLYFCTV